MTDASPSGNIESRPAPGAGHADAVSLEQWLASGWGDITHLLPKPGDEITAFLALAAELAAALHEIHQNRGSHGSISTFSVLIEPGLSGGTSEHSRVHIIPANTAASIHSLEAYGRLHFISPEQTGRMNRDVDQRTDLYALGVILYRLLTGHVPFTATAPLALVHALIASRPAPPIEIRPNLPLPISDIVVKLLAKDPRDRYQTASGLKSDLENCREQWHATGHIASFALGQNDFSDRLLLPQSLYGRRRELDRLLRHLDDACSGDAQLLLLSGESGAGKSSLLGTLRGPATDRGATLVIGQVNLQQQHHPYAAIIAALQDFVRQLLAGDQTRLAVWRDRLTDVLAGNTAPLIKRIPELALLLEAPADSLAEASDPKLLLNLALQRFIRAVAESSHPLVVAIDDAQWADEDSLQLLRDLTTASAICLLVICTYRAAPGLPESLDDLIAHLPDDRHLVLAPFEPADTSRFLADTLHASPERVAGLAELVQRKTGGNPLFVREFLRSLVDRHLIYFGTQDRVWHWNLEGIQAAPIADSVVELVRTRLHRLPEGAQTTLKTAAILGTRFDAYELASTRQMTPQEAAQDLGMAVELNALVPLVEDISPHLRVEKPSEPRLSALENLASEYMIPLQREAVAKSGDPAQGESNGDVEGANPGSQWQQRYAFAHAQIRDAAALLVPELTEETIHYRIGRGLLQIMAPEQRRERSYFLVRHLNQASALLRGWAERIELAELNLQAGQQALALAAYHNAHAVATAGALILSDFPDHDGWRDAYALMRDLHLTAAQAAARSGRFERAEQLLEAADQHAISVLDGATTAQARIIACYLQGRHAEACAAAVAALRRLGIHLPEHPRNRDVLLAMARTRLAMLGRSIDSLAGLQPMTDEHSVKALEILSAATISAASVEPKLLMIIGLEMVWQTVKHGFLPLSAMGYALHGMLLSGVVGQIDNGYAFGQLALRLAPQMRSKERRVFVKYFVYAHINHWKEPVAATLEPLRDLAVTGEFEYLAIAAGLYPYLSWFISGLQVESYERGIAENLHLLEPFRGTPLFYRYRLGQQFYQNLLGRGGDPCDLVGDAYDERQMLTVHLRQNDRTTIFYLACHKLVLCVLFECYERAQNAARLAADHKDGAVGTPLIPVFHFYDSLARLAMYPSGHGAEDGRTLKTVEANQRKMRKWARKGPANCLHRHTLVEAERARVRGETATAREMYDAAIGQARDHEYVMELAVAHELAARFYLALDQPGYAQTHLRAAYGCFQRWGAPGKLRQLESRYPQFFPGPVDLANLSAHLDMTSLLKAAQVLSRETTLPRLLDTLSQILVENAGAEQGYLLLLEGGHWRVVAGAPNGAPDANSSNRPAVAMSIVWQVAAAREPVLINDVAASFSIFQDLPPLARRPRSILCLPLLDKGELVGVFYMENTLTRDAFPVERLEPLTMLAAQAAVSLKNASLVAGLQEAQEKILVSEQRFRLLFENAPLGIFEVDISAVTPTIRAANRRAEAVYGWTSAELGTLDPAILIPDENRQEMQRLVETVRSGKTAFLETTNRRRDGAVFPVRIIATPARDQGGPHMIVAVEDISAERQRRSEAEAIDEERRRIAQEIHDGVAQDLAFLRLKLALWREWVRSEPERMHDELDQTQDTLDAAIEEIRRSIYSLRPLALDEVGLVTGLQRYVADLNNQYDVFVDLEIGLEDDQIPAQLELLLFRAVQEGLNNVIQHAAASLAWVRLVPDGVAVKLTIRDNGQGFDVASLDEAGRSGHLGLKQMRERIEKAGGQLMVFSRRGQGTEIQVNLPVS